MNQDIKYDTFVVVLNNKDSDNNNGEFEITFKKPIQLRNDMEVALTHIDIPKNVWSINSSDLFMTLNMNFPAIHEEVQYPAIIENNLEPWYFLKTYYFSATNIEEFFSYYESIKNDIHTLIDKYIVKRIKNYRTDGNDYPDIKVENGLTYNKIGNSRVDRQRGKNGLVTFAYSYFNFSKNLHKILGFDIDKFPNVIYDENTKIASNESKAINKPDFKKIVDILFVYSYIVKETYFGNTKSNILTVFPFIKLDKNKIISYNFEHLFYIPLRVNEIISIKISIRDSLSNIIIYDEGEISLTLIFRPKEHI